MRCCYSRIAVHPATLAITRQRVPVVQERLAGTRGHQGALKTSLAFKARRGQRGPLGPRPGSQEHPETQPLSTTGHLRPWHICTCARRLARRNHGATLRTSGATHAHLWRHWCVSVLRTALRTRARRPNRANTCTHLHSFGTAYCFPRCAAATPALRPGALCHLWVHSGAPSVTRDYLPKVAR